MAGSFITIFRWSIYSMSSLVLIALWAFNPLGSQASFRGAFLRPGVGTSQGHISYYNANLTTQQFLYKYATRTKANAFYASSLYDYVASTQYVNPSSNLTQGVIAVLGGEKSAGVQAATETWGNFRIPSLEYHSDFNANNSHSWLSTPWNDEIMNYSSLVGDHVDGIDRNFLGNTSFQTSSSYQSLTVSWRHYCDTTSALTKDV
jgi:hypothetical protein